MPPFHFNRRDVSFRTNLDALGTMDGLDGILVTVDRRNIHFEWIQATLDTIAIGEDEHQVVFKWGEVEMVVVEC